MKKVAPSRPAKADALRAGLLAPPIDKPIEFLQSWDLTSLA
jgi:hypothetical protein